MPPHHWIDPPPSLLTTARSTAAAYPHHQIRRYRPSPPPDPPPPCVVRAAVIGSTRVTAAAPSHRWIFCRHTATRGRAAIVGSPPSRTSTTLPRGLSPPLSPLLAAVTTVPSPELLLRGRSGERSRGVGRDRARRGEDRVEWVMERERGVEIKEWKWESFRVFLHADELSAPHEKYPYFHVWIF